MAPILYHNNLSPPVRAVLLTAKAIGLELELKEVNLLQKDHLKPEYVKMNPQHTIPTLDDDGFIIWDSHAICTYLVGKYAKDDSLYPKDLKKRAIVDQRLHFDSGILFPRLKNIFFYVLFKGEKIIPQHKLDDLTEALQFLEAFLTEDWLAGDHTTLADFSMVTLINCFEICCDLLTAEKYPKIVAWYERCKALPYFEEANDAGFKSLTAVFKEKMNSA